jgi:hypothetical protein
MLFCFRNFRSLPIKIFAITLVPTVPCRSGPRSVCHERGGPRSCQWGVWRRYWAQAAVEIDKAYYQKNRKVKASIELQASVMNHNSCGNSGVMAAAHERSAHATRDRRDAAANLLFGFHRR